MLRSPAGIIASAKTVIVPSVPTTGEYTHIGTSTSNTVAGGNYTFLDRFIGTAAVDRRVVVAVAGRDVAAYPTSVTIGGITATRDGGRALTGVISIWSAIVPTGTTATVVITYAGTQTYCGAGIWITNGAPVSTTFDEDNGTGPLTMDLPTIVGDFVIAAVAHRTTSGSNTVEWTGITQRYDAAIDGLVRQHSGGDIFATDGLTEITATIPFLDESVCCAVAYRAA